VKNQAKQTQTQQWSQIEISRLGFQVGDLVEAHSLQSASHLNGLQGRIGGLQVGEPLRLQVEFAKPYGGKALRPANLKLVTKPAPPLPVERCAAGLTLAGKPLEPPRLHAVDWRVNQRFAAADDPDRTKEPWTPPSFVCQDPVLRRETLSVDEVTLPIKPEARSFARVVHNVLSEEECAALIQAVNVKGFTPALLNIGGGMQMLAPEVRDGHRVIVDSVPLSSWLLEVLRPHLPEVFRKGERLHSINERCRFLCYTPGQEFAAHHDGRFTHPISRAASHVTIQLYLHDVPESNGGATTFLFNDHPSVPCQPAVGSVLIFSQDLEHEGSLLKHGLKYTFRTEAMYRA
jgi:hypothetical protein